ncbi:DUF6660 family protein [Flagellimonas sp. 2504JD4-2]
MKWILIVFSAYFLSLNLLPCGDEALDSQSIKTEVSCADSAHEHDEGHLCSPFCQCQCCHVHVISADLAILLPTKPDFSSELHTDKQGVIQEILYSLFQPPRFFG